MTKHFTRPQPVATPSFSPLLPASVRDFGLPHCYFGLWFFLEPFGLLTNGFQALIEVFGPEFSLFEPYFRFFGCLWVIFAYKLAIMFSRYFWSAKLFFQAIIKVFEPSFSLFWPFFALFGQFVGEFLHSMTIILSYILFGAVCDCRSKVGFFLSPFWACNFAFLG